MARRQAAGWLRRGNALRGRRDEVGVIFFAPPPTRRAVTGRGWRRAWGGGGATARRRVALLAWARVACAARRSSALARTTRRVQRRAGEEGAAFSSCAPPELSTSSGPSSSSRRRPPPSSRAAKLTASPSPLPFSSCSPLPSSSNAPLRGRTRSEGGWATRRTGWAGCFTFFPKKNTDIFFLFFLTSTGPRGARRSLRAASRAGDGPGTPYDPWTNPWGRRMRGWADAGPRFVSCPPGVLDAPQDLPGPLRPLLASPQRLRSLASPPAPPRPRASSWLRLWGWQGRLNILEAALPHPPD